MQQPTDSTPSSEDRQRYIRESHRQTGRALHVLLLFVLGGALLVLAELPSHLALDVFGWEHLKTTDFLFGLAAALLYLAGAISAPAAGYLVDRIGARLTILAGMGIGGGGLILFGLGPILLLLFPAYALIGAGQTMGGWLPVMVAVCRRFHRRRAMAIAITMTVGELGKLIPLVTLGTLLALAANPDSGWVSVDTLFIALGAVLLAVAIPAYALVRRQRADAKTKLPAGGEGPGDDAAAEPSLAPAEPDFTARQALRTRAFRFIVAGYSLAMVSSYVISIYLAFWMSDEGYSLTAAGGAIGLNSFISICFTLVGGFVGDRYSLRKAMAVFAVLQSAGIVLLVFADSLGLILLAVSVVGIGGGIGPLSVAIQANYFGTKSLGKILGWHTMAVSLMAIIAPILGGVILDSSGFTVMFLLLAGLGLLGALCFLRARQPSPPDAAPEPPWAPLR